MTQNPYAQPELMDESSLPRRTSIAAIFALILALLCFIPGAGALALLMGALAIAFITSSKGRLSGTGLAVTAVVLGLISSVVWIFVFVGAVNVSKQLGGKFFVPIGAAAQAVENSDYNAVRAAMDPTVGAAITDADIDAFRAVYTQDLGAFKSMPQSLMSTIKAYSQLGQQMQNFQQGTPGLMPMPAEFANGWGILLIQMPTTGGGGQPPAGTWVPPLENFGYLDTQGNTHWLYNPHGVPVPVPPGGPSDDAGEGEGEDEDDDGMGGDGGGG